MRHPWDNIQDTAGRIEALLHEAAAFEPALPAPDDLVERAMFRGRRPVARVRVSRPLLGLIWGGLGATAAASATAALVAGALTETPLTPSSLTPVRGRIAAPAVAVDTTPVISPRIEPPRPRRRSFRTVRVAYRPRPAVSVPAVPVAAVEKAPLKAVWQEETQTVRQEFRPVWRVWLDEDGAPVEVQPGVLVSTSYSCGPRTPLEDASTPETTIQTTAEPEAGLATADSLPRPSGSQEMPPESVPAELERLR